MIQSPSAFGNYLAISPALWFGDELILRQLSERLDKGSVFDARLATFVGEREERTAPQKVHMTSNVLELARRVAEHERQFPNGAMISVIPDMTHHSVVAPAITKGLRFLISPDDRRAETF